MMKNRMLTGLLCMALFVAIFLSGCASVRVDNSVASAELVQHNYNQEDFFTIQAIFQVQRSFHTVSVSYLCEYEGLQLECKREIADGYDYYVLLDHTIHCFIFVDNKDDVQNVLVTYRFPTLQDVQERCGSENPYDQFPNFEDGRVAIDLGTNPAGSSEVVHFCSDGVVMATFQNGAKPHYTFYTDDEWEAAYPEITGYHILPIDKQ